MKKMILKFQITKLSKPTNLFKQYKTKEDKAILLYPLHSLSLLC